MPPQLGWKCSVTAVLQFRITAQQALRAFWKDFTLESPASSRIVIHVVLRATGIAAAANMMWHDLEKSAT
jgi:hypothetical protein